MTAAYDHALFTSDTSDGKSRCYPARLVRIIDGDTIVVDIDFGFSEWRHGEKLRLLNINCPEINTDAGKAARDFVVEWFETHGQNMQLVTIKDKSNNDKADSFGRYLAWAALGGSA